MSHFEDWKTYTEVDAGGDIVVEPHTITVTTMIKNVISYVKKYCGPSHFGDFEHTLHVKLTYAEEATAGIFWAVSNGNYTFTAMENNDGILANFYNTSGTYQIRLRDCINQSQVTYDIGLNVDYYIKIIRKGQSVTMRIYSDPGMTNLLKTLSKTAVPPRMYQDIISIGSRQAAGTETISYTVEDLDLQEKPANQFSLRPHVKGNVLNKEGWMRT